MSNTDLDLAGIEARLKAISIEPLELETDERQMDDSHYWTAEIKNGKGDTIADIADDYWNYGEFFANAPTDIAALVARVRELEAENKARFTEGAKETKERVLSAIDMAGLMEVKFGTKDRARVIAEIKLLVQSIEVEVE